jgi:hypothetical protein
MPTSLVPDTLRVKRAVLFIAALITSLTVESRSAEVIPPNSGGVVLKEAAYRFNEELAQFDPPTSNRLKDRIDSSRDSALVIANLKVRLDDRGPGEPIAEENRGSGASTETPTKRTTVVSSVHEEERELAPPVQTTPSATATAKPVHEGHRGFDARLWLIIIFVIALILIIWRIPRRPPPGPEDKESNIEIPPSYPLRIAIKFKSGGGELPQQLDGWRASLKGTAKALAPLRLLPLFESQDLDRLSRLIDRARRNDPHYEPPDFSAWLQVETPAGANADELAKGLRKLANVETAYVMRPGPPPLPVSPEDDRRNLNQGYQDAARKGIDARYAWDFLGGDGAGIGFVDLEQGWNLNHEDLKDTKITIISGKDTMYRGHGTSALGVVLMVDNKKGGVGIAPSAKGRVISQWQPELSPGSPTLHVLKTFIAIADAADKMDPGDVLLIEAQEHDPVDDSYEWPVEIFDLSYEKIRLATKAGIVVVEAGGNGGYDLDAYKNASGKKIFDRRSAGFRDSGAIMVGAACSTTHHHRLSRENRRSNYGSRIDCYAWGENIDTTITNVSGTSNTGYTPDFGGTSGASAIVAGAALIVQGIAQAALGRRFSPRELRDLLTNNGTPSANPETDKIGVMPDLQAIITNNQNKLKPIAISTPAPS